jgi:hypothetical protein
VLLVRVLQVYRCVILCFRVLCFLPVACPGIYTFVSIGMYSRSCIGIMDVFWVFSHLIWRVCCLYERLCGTGDIGVYACKYFMRLHV